MTSTPDSGGASTPERYGADHRIDPRTDPRVHRDDVVAHQRERFGGVKIGSAFFGWLAATGMTVILTALCGHGHFDLAAYDAYLNGRMVDDELSADRLAAGLVTMPAVG